MVGRPGLFVKLPPLGVLASLGLTTGCHSLMNSWLDPSVPGNFSENATTSIRNVLTVEDAPSAIPGATEPTREDLAPYPFEFRLGPGDVVAVEIEELRQVGEAFQQQFQLSPTGDIAIPGVGRFSCAGMSPVELEEELKKRLREAELLTDPKVLVIPVSVNSARFMIFGIGVSAAANSPLRAAPVPIMRPNLNLLEAISLVGGLNEFVTEAYIFRKEPPPSTTSPTSLDPGVGAGGGDEGGAAPFEMEEALGEQQPQRRDTAAPKPEGDIDAETELLNAAAPESLDPVPEAAAPDSGMKEGNGSASPPSRTDTLYIYQDGKIIANPAHRDEPGAEPPVERMPFFEAVQSSVDWSRIAGDSHYRIIRVPAEALRTGDPAYMVIIHPGDVIRIVSGEIGVYYVMGQVNRVGPFTFNSEQVTLKSAIAAAGGLGPLAWPSRCTIYRRQGSREQMVQVDLDAVFAGKLDDVEIRRGDIINVGTSPLAPWLLRLRALTLPNPTATVGYGFTYSRNFADIDSFAVQPNPVTRPSKFEQLFP